MSSSTWDSSPQTPKIVEQAGIALDEAYRLAPNNLVLLLERLLIQVDSEDAAIVETLQAGMPRWKQLAPGVQKRVRIDLLDLVDQATTAAAGEDWPSVRRNVLFIRNVVTPEEATRSDRRRLERHALEFVMDTFSEPVRELAQTNQTEFISPSFEESPLPISLAIDETLVAIAVGDINLDTRTDIVCLTSDRIVCLSVTDNQWSTIMECPVNDSSTEIILLDLDDDVDQTPQHLQEANGQHPSCHRADLDVLVWGPNGVQAFENRLTDQGRNLQAISLPEGLTSLNDTGLVHPADLDADGDLDLLTLSAEGVGLWQNRGNHDYARDALTVWNLPPEKASTAATTVDRDGDIDLDVLLLARDGSVGWLENLLQGEFQWRSLEPTTVTNAQMIETVDAGDHWAIVAAGEENVAKTDWQSPSDVWTKPLRDVGVVGLQIGDVNNDGWIDVAGWTSTELFIVPSSAIVSSEFTTDATISIPLVGAIDAQMIDLNDDGWLDFVTASPEGLRVHRNPTDAEQGWQKISLLAEQVKGSDLSASGRVNHCGLGSIIEIKRGSHHQRQVVRSPVTHFGLGSSERADTVRVLWTNGVPENVIQPDPKTFICERQTLKGSCPYVYGWNGEEFAFITDLLWASPIGLVGPDGKLVPARPWEHLKIDGSQLRERDGVYELRITEELWEAAYFDSVTLTAIDHPADVDFFTNEKVGPPFIAEHRLHPVRNRIRPKSAIDQKGRDVLPLVIERDECYAKFFDRKLRQGHTEPTTLELDFGNLADAKEITLYLTGWI